MLHPTVKDLETTPYSNPLSLRFARENNLK
jgi:hypothetical protein